MHPSPGSVFLVVQAILVLTFCFLHGHKLPWERGFISNHHFSEVSAFQQTWKSLGSFLSASIESQMLTAQNNPYPEVAYFRVACFDPLDTTLWGKESGILRDFRWHVLGERGSWPHMGGLCPGKQEVGGVRTSRLPSSYPLSLRHCFSLQSSWGILNTPQTHLLSKLVYLFQAHHAAVASVVTQFTTLLPSVKSSSLNLRLFLPVSCIKHQNWFLAFNSVV